MHGTQENKPFQERKYNYPAGTAHTKDFNRMQMKENLDSLRECPDCGNCGHPSCVFCHIHEEKEELSRLLAAEEDDKLEIACFSSLYGEAF